jgi:hypothetical protein
LGGKSWITDQPWIWDEPLSKVAAGLDIAAAREKLARRFNRRPVRLPKSVEVERAWEEHNESIRHPIGPRRRASTRGAAERVFPGATRDLITIRTKPISALPRERREEHQQRERTEK